MDLAVEEQKEFLKHVGMKEKDVLARRRAVIDELDLFDGSGNAAHNVDGSVPLVCLSASVVICNREFITSLYCSAPPIVVCQLYIHDEIDLM